MLFKGIGSGLILILIDDLTRTDSEKDKLKVFQIESRFEMYFCSTNPFLLYYTTFIHSTQMKRNHSKFNLFSSLDHWRTKKFSATLK
jgi:hypothetical protein